MTSSAPDSGDAQQQHPGTETDRQSPPSRTNGVAVAEAPPATAAAHGEESKRLLKYANVGSLSDVVAAAGLVDGLKRADEGNSAMPEVNTSTSTSSASSLLGKRERGSIP